MDDWGANGNTGLPRGGVYPPSGTAVFLVGGGRPDPPEATDPQNLRLERGKEAKASQFPLESHYFTFSLQLL